MLVVINLSHVHSSDYNCFSASQQKTLTYTDSGREVDSLPQIRLFDGVYDSQWAMQTVAYIYLQEKMGINVTWYPNGIEIPNRTYPFFFFDELANDTADLLFELWSVTYTIANADKYFYEGSVIDAGSSGVFGEAGFFVPRYFADTNPTVIVPWTLKNNDTLRNIMINALINGSDTNWIEKFYDIRPELRNSSNYNNTSDWTINGYDFDLPNSEIPTVFGSVDEFGISSHSYALCNNAYVSNGNGIDWNFATFGTEALLSEFIYDMYSKQLPFMVNIYRYDFELNVYLIKL